nr:MAG TPA: hypothetical protein [Caudoviricetes sp.]
MYCFHFVYKMYTSTDASAGHIPVTPDWLW